MNWNVLAVAVAVAVGSIVCGGVCGAEAPFLKSGERVVFLGDSITHAGQYISLLDAHLRRALPGAAPELINLGLPSETCSGLSEPDHPFPRPDVHERLDRALAKTKPDVVMVCYGMNDGIYYPFSEARFASFREGINLLIAKVRAAGARLVLMTPPPFDPEPLRKHGKLQPAEAEKHGWIGIYENYDDVLKRYSEWILEQGARVELVIDLHSAVNAYLIERRKADAAYVMSGDGVHLNDEGHRILAQTISAALGTGTLGAVDPELLRRVNERQHILRAAWLSHVGHQRPGMGEGLPLEEAQKKAAEFETQIDRMLR